MQAALSIYFDVFWVFWNASGILDACLAFVICFAHIYDLFANVPETVNGLNVVGQLLCTFSCSEENEQTLTSFIGKSHSLLC